MAQDQTPGFMEKIKEKLPGHHRKPDLSGETEETVPRVTDDMVSTETASTPRPEKKSMMQKIKEKLSGHQGKENPEAPDVPGRHSEELEVKGTESDGPDGGGYVSRKAGAKKAGVARSSKKASVVSPCGFNQNNINGKILFSMMRSSFPIWSIAGHDIRLGIRMTKHIQCLPYACRCVYTLSSMYIRNKI
ncbi:unnamed protein product [Calypogeia fissa]